MIIFSHPSFLSSSIQYYISTRKQAATSVSRFNMSSGGKPCPAGGSPCLEMDLYMGTCPANHLLPPLPPLFFLLLPPPLLQNMSKISLFLVASPAPPSSPLAHHSERTPSSSSSRYSPMGRRFRFR
eukprot:768683-Hanusia_phi.AAC.3